MKMIASGLLALTLALPVYAEELAPLRSTSNGHVVGMILTDHDDVHDHEQAFDHNEFYVRASVSIIKRKHANTAWLFCRGMDGRIGSVGRLDGTIGSRVLERLIDVEAFCRLESGEGMRVMAVDIVIVDHGKPVNTLLDGVEGSVIQVTTNNVSDPFCNGSARPPRECKVIATGTAPLHRHMR